MRRGRGTPLRPLFFFFSIFFFLFFLFFSLFFSFSFCEVHKPGCHNQSVTTTTTTAQANTQARAGALMAHHPAWVGHTGGSRSPVHPCPLRWGGCGLLTNSTTHNNESKKTQHDNNMVAEQVLRDLSVRRLVCVHGVCRRS